MQNIRYIKCTISLRTLRKPVLGCRLYLIDLGKSIFNFSTRFTFFNNFLLPERRGVNPRTPWRGYAYNGLEEQSRMKRMYCFEDLTLCPYIS